MGKTAGDFGNFNDVLTSAQEQVANSWEEQFVSDTTDKYTQYGDRMFISDKQIVILERIAKMDLTKRPPKPDGEPQEVDDIPF